MTADDPPPDRAPPAGPTALDPAPSRSAVRSEDLLGGHREILIEHDGQLYRLRVTHKNKLILTK